ncbi:MAG TPA: ROK family protein [Syntrophorhabdaceae bacterium]
MRIGIDLGGTKIVGGLVDASGNVTGRTKIPTVAGSGYAGVLADLASLVNEVIAKSGISRKAVERIGIASAGQIEKYTQKIVFSPNLGWWDVPLKDDLERETGIAVMVENDVNAATYGEWKFGLRQTPSHVLGVFVGTGIGGGLILDGRIYRGFSNVGGEIGHMTLNPEGYRCHCGNRGCFEAYCGGSYIVERVRGRLREGYRGKVWGLTGGMIELLNAGHIEQAAMEGDELCNNLWAEVVEYMGAGLASLVNILNPELVMLGGGVIFGSTGLMEDAAKAMERRVMPASAKGLRIEKVRLGEDAAIVGAAYMEE